MAQSKTPGKQHDVQNDSDVSRISVIPKSFTGEIYVRSLAILTAVLNFARLRHRWPKLTSGFWYVWFLHLILKTNSILSILRFF